MRKIGKNVLLIVCMTFFSIIFNYSAYADDNNIDTDRWYGNNRYETAVSISRSMWNSSFYAIVASGENFPDALSAASLAKYRNAPILLTEQDHLDNNTRLRLKELNVSFVYIIGGTSAVSEAVEKQITNMGIQVKRVEGVDRYDTSAKVAEQLDGVSEVVLATGTDFADALSVAPIAAKRNMPILLTPKYSLTNALRDYGQTHDITKIYVMGDTDIISEDTVKLFAQTVAESGNKADYPTVVRITGKDKYIRNANVIKKFLNIGDDDGSYEQYNYEDAYIATGSDFPDALAGSVVAAKKDAPIILVDDSDTSLAQNLIKAGDVEKLHILGGYSAIGNEVVAKILKGNSSDDSDQVTFQDPNLERAIRREINKPSGKITRYDVENITKLRVSFADVTNLSGIENLKYLEDLNLDYNSIRELYPLRNLTNLRTLSLNHNFISDLSPLSTLTDLEELDLSSNQIKDLKPLTTLYDLEELDLRSNQIHDLYPLEEVSGLNTLYLGDNPIIDYTPIDGYYDNLNNVDFDLNEVSKDPLDGFEPSVDHISAKDKKLIKSFQDKYNNSSYNMYKILYKSFDNGSYESELNAMLSDRKFLMSQIADVNNAKNISSLNARLQDLNMRISKVQAEEEMNSQISIIEEDLNAAVKEKERTAKRNKINLIYCEYMKGYYQNELSQCTKEIGEDEALMQSLGNNDMRGLTVGESDRIRAKIDDLHQTVEILKSHKEILEEREELYTDSYNFYNVVDCILNNDDIY